MTSQWTSCLVPRLSFLLLAKRASIQRRLIRWPKLPRGRTLSKLFRSHTSRVKKETCGRFSTISGCEIHDFRSLSYSKNITQMVRSEDPWDEVGSADLSDDGGESSMLSPEDADIVLLPAAPPSPPPPPRRTIWEIIAARMAGSAFDPRHVAPEQRKINEAAVKKRFQFDPTKRHPYTSRCGRHQVVGYFNLYAQGKIGLFTEEGFPVYVKLEDLSDESIDYVLYQKLGESLRAKVKAQLKVDHSLERVGELKKIEDKLKRQELAATTAVQLDTRDDAWMEFKAEKGCYVCESERKLIARSIDQLDEVEMKEPLVLLQKHIPNLGDINHSELEVAIGTLPKDVLLTLVDFLKKCFAQAAEILLRQSSLNDYTRGPEIPSNSKKPSKTQALFSAAQQDMKLSHFSIKERNSNLEERLRKNVDKPRGGREANDRAADESMKQALDSEATSDAKREANACDQPGKDRPSESDDLFKTMGNKVEVPARERKDAEYEINRLACKTPVAARAHVFDGGIALTKPVAGGRSMPLRQSRMLSSTGKSNIVNDENMRPHDEYRQEGLVSSGTAPEPRAIDELVESIEKIDLNHEDQKREAKSHLTRIERGIGG